MEIKKDRDGNVIHWLNDTWGLLEIHTFDIPSKICYRPVMKVSSMRYITIDVLCSSFESGITAIENELLAMKWIDQNDKH